MSVKPTFPNCRVLILYYLLAKQNIYDLPKVLRSKPNEVQFVKQSMFKVMERAETVKLRLVFLSDQLKLLSKPLNQVLLRKDGKFSYYYHVQGTN